MKDLSRLSWDQVRRRKVVTGLCAAGLSIGCAAIILAMSIGESAQTYIETEMNSFFSMDEITVYADQGVQARGGPSTVDQEALERGRLTEQKLEVIRNMPHVIAAAPYEEFGYQEMVTTDGKRSYVQIYGTDLATLADFGKTFMQGGASDLSGTMVLNYGATLGLVDEEARDKLLEQLSQNPYDEQLNDQYERMTRLPTAMYQRQAQFRLYGMDNKLTLSSALRVSGILQKPAGASDRTLANGSKEAYVSMETLELLKREQGGGTTASSSGAVSYNTVKVKVDDQANVEAVERQIQKLTLSTQTNLHQKEQLAEQFKIIKAVALGGGIFILIIASISIVVAMTMSTYQRKRQIGIMKVLGANLAQIRNLFIVEAALLGFLGGLLGVLFSYWIVWGINALIHSMSGEGDAVVIFIPLVAIPVGMAFAIMTGVISGIYPAVSASRTDALTAIRRE
nr:ABC transporter permease [Paenibacillus phyllosphaerae]